MNLTRHCDYACGQALEILSVDGCEFQSLMRPPQEFLRPPAKVAAAEVRACQPGCDRWEFFAREGGEGASACGDAGMRREVAFVAFSQLGKFLEGGEFLQVLEPKVNQELAGRFVEKGASGVVLVAGGGDELAFGSAPSTPGASTRRMA